MHDDVEASSHKFGCLSETDVLARGNLISGEQVASLRKRVHDWLPALQAILRWGNLRRLRKIIGAGSFVTVKCALYVACTLRLQTLAE